MSDSQPNSNQVDLTNSEHTRNFSDKFKNIQQEVFGVNQESDCFKKIFESAAIGIAKVAMQCLFHFYLSEDVIKQYLRNLITLQLIF
ncbi:MAG: hypothetical protein AAFX46_23155 [Cyanobacteria bacterium J06636_27]